MKRAPALVLMSALLVLALVLLRFSPPVVPTAARTLRVGQFNIWEMSTAKILETDESGAGSNEQLLAAAEIIRELAPEILFVNEIDHDYEAVAGREGLALNARRFNDLYLRRGANPIDYPYAYAAACNTGILSGQDLNNDGIVATEAHRNQREYGSDSFGYGVYPGQYSMAILSQYPLLGDEARTFQTFRWADLPDNHIPPGYHAEEELAIYRLSSKSHWDVPVQVGDRRIHLLFSHPTPTGYDGPEDQNGRRNYDEISMWAHYLDDDSVMVDDSGRRGGLPAGESFILAGDLNAAPHGDRLETGESAIDQLLTHERIRPTGEFLTSRGPLNGREPGPPLNIERRTVGWGDQGLRIDYILPSADLTPIAGGVHWPDPLTDPEGEARAQRASDHRMTWLEIELD